MDPDKEEEEKLKKRLEDLEKKYRDSLFSENLKRTVENQIREDSKKKIESGEQIVSPVSSPPRPDVNKPITNVPLKTPPLKNIISQIKNTEPVLAPAPINRKVEPEQIPENKKVSAQNLPQVIKKPEATSPDISAQDSFEKKLNESSKIEVGKPETKTLQEKSEEKIYPKPEIKPEIKLEVKTEIKSEETYIDRIMKILPHHNDDPKNNKKIEAGEKPEDNKKYEGEKKSNKVKNIQGKFGHYDKPSEAEILKCTEGIKKIKEEMGKVLIGQEDIVEGLIMGLICNSHVLVEGVPGIAKTLAIRTLASCIGCDVKRIQFTVDLLPTDIIGITSYTPEKGFEIIKGPIFTNFLIADEINRAPPKTQSALIEAMQEKQVTIGREKFTLPAPFFVMATENPIENAGVYPLPEAQIDRFLFKLVMGYPKEDEEKIVMESNMTLERFENFDVRAAVKPEDIIYMQEVVKKIYLDDSIKSYILQIVRKTRERDFSMSQYISYGSSPRASIGLYIASKANALINGRNFVLPEDVKKVVYNVLRHRLILSYKATIQKVSEDSIIKDILNSIKVE